MKLPCKEKYIDEAVPDWVVLKNNDGTFDITHADDYFAIVFQRLEREIDANEIVKMQNEFKDKLRGFMGFPS